MLQYREVIGGEVRTFGDDSDHQIEAKVCSYGVGPDTYNTTWEPGCFRSALDQPQGLPAVCWSHQPDSIIGSVTGYTDNPDGLYVQMRMANFDEVPDAKKAYSLVRDGHVKGWSFGFTDGETEPDPDHEGAMRFRSARMYEVSPVLRASVPLTKTVAVRSADGDTEAATDADLEKVIAAGVRAALASDEPLVIGDEKRAPETAQVDDSLGEVFVTVKPKVDKEAFREAIEEASEPEARPDLEPLLRAIVEANDYARSLLHPDDVNEDMRATLEIESEAVQALAEALGFRDSAKKPAATSGIQLDTPAHVQAAWTWINKDVNAGKYPIGDTTLEDVKSKIRAAAKKFKINLATTQGGSAGDSPENSAGSSSSSSSDSPAYQTSSKKKRSDDDEDDTLTRLTLMGLSHR